MEELGEQIRASTSTVSPKVCTLGLKEQALVEYLFPQACHLLAQVLSPNLLPQPGDALQVEQQADELMAVALGVIPGRVMGTQKQHCPAFYISSPCGEKAVNICSIQPPHLYRL